MFWEAMKNKHNQNVATLFNPRSSLNILQSLKKFIQLRSFIKLKYYSGTTGEGGDIGL